MRIALFVLAASLLLLQVAFAQPALPRVAIVYNGTPEIDKNDRDTFEQAMRSDGYVDGKNMVLDSVFIGGRNEGLTRAIRDLIGRKPAVIVVWNSQATHAAKAATTTIPIVMGAVGDPVGQGYVASLARPGGNITGNATLTLALGAKRLEILKELVPKATQVGYIVNVANPGYPVAMQHVEASARNLGIRVVQFRATNEAELDSALLAVAAARMDAVIMTGDPLGNLHRRKIVESLSRTRMPAIHSFAEAVVDGGLISYTGDRAEFSRSAARFVDRILKGAKPADLPIEQPTKFNLVVNLKTAKALGITIPQTVLLRADRVIE